MYSARLLDHFQNPRNVGELPPPAVTVEVSNPVCGDVLRLSVEFRDGRVAEARFKTRGCTASIAAGSALTEWLLGKAPAEIAGLRALDVENAVGRAAVHRGAGVHACGGSPDPPFLLIRGEAA